MASNRSIRTQRNIPGEWVVETTEWWSRAKRCTWPQHSAMHQAPVHVELPLLETATQSLSHRLETAQFGLQLLAVDLVTGHALFEHHKKRLQLGKWLSCSFPPPPSSPCLPPAAASSAALSTVFVMERTQLLLLPYRTYALSSSRSCMARTMSSPSTSSSSISSKVPLRNQRRPSRTCLRRFPISRRRETCMITL